MTIKRDVARTLAMGAVLLGICGCGSPSAEFLPNAVYIKKGESDAPIAEPVKRDMVNLLVALFGDPDDPKVPSLEEVTVSDVLDIDQVGMSAGPVRRDARTARGLYREHCVHCHGITGDGAGPTAVFLNPYPRDFRMGVFKFKSTPLGRKPTHDDLKHTLIQGISGTAMPSFKLLAEDEIESLVHYVKYLSVRGQVEREMVDAIQIGDLDTEESGRLVSVALKEKDAELYDEQLAEVQGIVGGVVERWSTAGEFVTEIPQRPASLDADEASRKKSIDDGRNLFYGIGGCAKCHGNSALGDGQTTDYDNWAKEIMVPPNEELLEEYIHLGALPPRNIRPRNLRLGSFRGGRRPIDIYRRIRNGIEGTPMPAATLKTPSSPSGMTQEQIWNLVDYVRNLPYEPLSQPPKQESQNPRKHL